MTEPVGGRRIDVLANIFACCAADRVGQRTFAVNTVAREVEPGTRLPKPASGTGFHAVLAHVAPLAMP
jgi:hypothetical protein